jgi:hypothetical protein
MGQAFDQYGHLLGEAEGDSFSEVAKKLELKYADAAELRIRTLHEALDRQRKIQEGRPALVVVPPED